MGYYASSSGNFGSTFPDSLWVPSSGVENPKDGTYILCFVDGAPPYNLVNKANLVHNLFLVYLFISTCFGRLRTHHQEKYLCLCDTWYLLFYMDDCLVCRMESTMHPRQSSLQNNKCQVSHEHSCLSWWWAHSRPKHVEIDKYTKNKYSSSFYSATALSVWPWLPL